MGDKVPTPCRPSSPHSSRISSPTASALLSPRTPTWRSSPTASTRCGCQRGAVRGARSRASRSINFGSLRSPIDVHDLTTRLWFPRPRDWSSSPTAPPRAECNQLLAFRRDGLPVEGGAGARRRSTRYTWRRAGLTGAAKISGERGGGKRTSSAGGPELLTPREADVLGQLQDGPLRTREIADSPPSLGIETVKTHARSIYRKLGVKSRRELARLKR